MICLKVEDEALRQEYSKLWIRGDTYIKIADELHIPFTKALTLRLIFCLPPRMPSRYSIAGKQLSPITDEDYANIMMTGDFKKEHHKGYATGLYYTAVRREELRRALRKQFQITKSDVVFSVLKRLKHGIETPPLKIPKDAPFIYTFINAIEQTEPNSRVFNYSKKTCYNIMRRAGFHYPHFCRLSRITNFFLEGWTIPQVHSWTGLSLRALNFYLGIVDIDKMGKSLTKKQTSNMEKGG